MLILPSLIINPTKLVFLIKNSHFLIATSICSFYSLFETYLMCSLYSFLGSYRPIALENTLSKILERVIANHIADMAKEHALLPQSQMGARKNRSTLSALMLLTATIKSA